MELAEPGIVSVLWFGLVVVVGGLVMFAISYFSMKETSYEDVVAKQRKQQELAEKDKTRINKLKKEQKKKSELKKKKSPADNSKTAVGNSKPPAEADSVTVAREVQIKPQPAEKEVLKVKEPKKKAKQPSAAKPTDEPIKAEVAPKNTSATISKATNQGEQRVKVEKLQKQPATAQEKPKAEKSPRQPPSSKEQAKPRAQQNGVETAPEVKTKKNKSRQEDSHPGGSLIEAVRSTKMDDETVQALLDILSQKSGSGDWYSTNSGKNKDLQKKLTNKDLEIVQHLQQLEKYKHKIDQLDKAMEAKKNAEAEREKQLSHYVAVEKELRKQQSEDKKQIFQLQSQVQNSTETSGSVQKLKEENELLRMTIQQNAQAVSDIAALRVDLESAQNKLKEGEAARSKLERQLKEHKSVKQRQVDVESYKKRIDEVTQKLHEAQSSYGKLDSDFQQAQTELQFSEDKCAKLLDQVTMLNEASDQRLDSLSETKEALEQRLVEMDANDSQKAEEAAKLHTQMKDLKKQVDELSAKNRALSEEVALERRSNNKVADDLQKNSDVMKEKENSIASLQTSNEAYKESTQKLESEVEKLKKKNNDLRERNWKAMDAVAAAEKSAKDKILASKDDVAKAVNSLESSVKAEISSKFPDISCTEKDFKSWLSSFLASASEATVVVNSTESEDNERKIKELEKLNLSLQQEASIMEQRLQSARDTADKFQALEKKVKDLLQTVAEKEADADKYKNILTSTEGFLSDLQKRVEEEEGELKNEMGKVTEENASLSKSLNEAKRQYNEALKKVEENSSSMAKLEAECAMLKQELKESRSIKPQENGQLDEVAKLKERLEKEKALTKNLGNAANKLQSVLKQTQEQLAKEREKNQEPTEQRAEGYSSDLD